MRREGWFCWALTGAFVMYGGVARSQEIAAAPFAGPMMLQGAPEEGGPPDEFGPMELLGFGGLHGGKVVTKAPFSATATSTQTLADGNQITRTGNVYRDSQGRFRREMALPGGSRSFVVISDPVAGTHYLLRPDEKVAYEMPGHGMKGPKGSGNGGPGQAWKGKGEANVQMEALGTQTIAGVSAEGTQYTRIIPAGQIGNTNPISIVSKRWYSPDLQIVVMSTHSDPRFGSTTYTLSNIQRQEPAAAMFAVPSDYTVKQGVPPHGMRKFRGGPPADAPPPPPGN
jgi:hypothetical protein